MSEKPTIIKHETPRMVALVSGYARYTHHLFGLDNLGNSWLLDVNDRKAGWVKLPTHYCEYIYPPPEPSEPNYDSEASQEVNQLLRTPK